MPEYSLDFAYQMAQASKNILENDPESLASKQASLYTSLVACEIGLKYALEKAGHQVKEIKKKQHDLSSLLNMVANCSVIRNLTENGDPRRVPASCIRSQGVEGEMTLGKLLGAESVGASKFPNEIRYGDSVKHYPVQLMSKLSLVLLAWVTLHENDIQA